MTKPTANQERVYEQEDSGPQRPVAGGLIMWRRLGSSGNRSPSRSPPPGGTGSWPLLLLLGVVIVPTVGVLWFMLAAMENERVAVRQRLVTAYRAQLMGVRSQLTASLQQQAARLDGRAEGAACAAVFAAVVRAGEADSLICTGGSPGQEYPSASIAASSAAERPDRAWRSAAGLERQGRFRPAAEAFARIARRSLGEPRAARALQAQARCLSRDGRKDAALEVLRQELSLPRYRAATDPQGRLIAPSALLLVAQLIGEPESEEFQLVAGALRERVEDYGEPVLPAPQRRFLMRELQAMLPEAPVFDTLAAEDLAAEYLASEPDLPPTSVLTRHPAEPDGPWRLASPSGRIVALYTEGGLRRRLAQAVARMAAPADTTAEILPPGVETDPSAIVVAFGAGEPLAGWRLSHELDEQAEVEAAARRQIAVYLWTGLLVIVLIVAATAAIARAIRGQMRSTRLKNDLLANVSHELKTPLASTRLLLDTLLEGPALEPLQAREYLELIAQENSRLARLVENFLSFSRFERGKQSFERREVGADSVVSAASAAAGERYQAPGCQLLVEVAPGLPPIDADPDAMVTVLLNLLDNAYKYSSDDKRIALSAFAEDGEVCLAVRDNGIGLSARERKRVFERFYQADQDLARTASGCGLGLSIVSFIVRAHGGKVDVTSRPGEGSTFTVRLPAAGRDAGGTLRPEPEPQEVAGR